jgi:hypothetical protein
MEPTSPKSKRKAAKEKDDVKDQVVEPEPEPSDAKERSKSKERARSKSPKASRKAIVNDASASSSIAGDSVDWESLPFEVCMKILGGLQDDLGSLMALSSVSVTWRQISTSEESFRSLFMATFAKLEPSDEYFLENGAPKPTLLKPAKAKEGHVVPPGPSSYFHLYAHKYPLHKRWIRRQFTTSLFKAVSDAERFSMLVPWRGFCVTAASDGNVCFWDPKSFATASSSSSSSSSTASSSNTKDTPNVTIKPKQKPRRLFNVHTAHIWWMTIQGDLCFTVSSDGCFKVTNLEPLITDFDNANLETITVISSDIPIWAIDVLRRSRRVVVGAQNGLVTLLSWKKGKWKEWKVIRSVKLQGGIWDVCLLPNQRFAACCNIDIRVYNFEPSDVEKELDAEFPPTAVQGALVPNFQRAVITPPDILLPAEGTFTLEQRSRAGLTRNLNFVDGLLISACSTVGLEAYNVDTGERVWTLKTKGVDIFDVGMTNNKLVCAGTDETTGYASVIVFDGRTHELILETGPTSSIGRVFSTCVTDESIYVCAVGSLYHVNFVPAGKTSKEDSGCVIS